MATIPHPFDMENQEDIERWFSEMEGYLNVKSDGYDFIHQGTDCAGRGYALEAFHALKRKLVRKCKHLKIREITIVPRAAGQFQKPTEYSWAVRGWYNGNDYFSFGDFPTKEDAQKFIEALNEIPTKTTKKDMSSECGVSEGSPCDGGVGCYNDTHPTPKTCKKCYCSKCSFGKCPPGA